MGQSSKEHTLLSWKAPEFHYHKKGQWWFPILAVATLSLTALFILTQQYLVAIIVILGGLVIYQLAHAEPEIAPVIFSPNGIKFHARFFAYNKLRTFWIIETDQAKRLYVQPIERFSRPVAIPLVKQDVEKIRDFLRHYLPESHDVEEDLGDILTRWLKI